jgi:hypothetical protein
MLVAPLIAGLLSAAPLAADASVGPPTFNERCRARFEAARAALSDLGPSKVEAAAGTGHFTSLGLVRLTVTRPGGGPALVAEVDRDRSQTLYRGTRGIVGKDYGTWHAPDRDTPAKPDGPLHEERHRAIDFAPGALLGTVRPHAADASAARFADVMKRTIEECLADLRPDEPDPTTAWRRTCAAKLEGSRRALATLEPAFGAGEVVQQSDSVWLKDPRHDARPTFQVMVECGRSPAPATRWARQNLFDAARSDGSCSASIWIWEAAPVVRAAALSALEAAADECLAAGRDTSP